MDTGGLRLQPQALRGGGGPRCGPPLVHGHRQDEVGRRQGRKGTQLRPFGGRSGGAKTCQNSMFELNAKQKVVIICLTGGLSISTYSHCIVQVLLVLMFVAAQEKYLFANEGDDHANNVKALESLKKGTEDWQSAEDSAGSH